MASRSSTIYHIAERAEWASDGGPYYPHAFSSDGFVHCSRWSQLPSVCRALFRGRCPRSPHLSAAM
ncbi:MAG: DUF952 domain-containing protein [Spirochaetales bacterium]